MVTIPLSCLDDIKVLSKSFSGEIETLMIRNAVESDLSRSQIVNRFSEQHAGLRDQSLGSRIKMVAGPVLHVVS